MYLPGPVKPSKGCKHCTRSRRELASQNGGSVNKFYRRRANKLFRRSSKTDLRLCHLSGGEMDTGVPRISVFW